MTRSSNCAISAWKTCFSVVDMGRGIYMRPALPINADFGHADWKFHVAGRLPAFAPRNAIDRFDQSSLRPQLSPMLDEALLEQATLYAAGVMSARERAQ